MFKNLRLGLKIGLGFASLLIIATALGGLAIWNMSVVSQQSQRLANEYVPEVDIAYHLEQSMLLAQFDMRLYGFVGTDESLRSTRDYLNATKGYIADAQALAAQYEGLATLRRNAGLMEEIVGEYEALVEETVVAQRTMAQARVDMDAAAAEFVENINDFLTGQNEELDREISELTSIEATQGFDGVAQTLIALLNDESAQSNRVQ